MANPNTSKNFRYDTKANEKYRLTAKSAHIRSDVFSFLQPRGADSAFLGAESLSGTIQCAYQLFRAFDSDPTAGLGAGPQPPFRFGKTLAPNSMVE